MPKVLDLTGCRFGMLTALSRLSEKEHGYYLWDCICDCGCHVKVSTKKLQRGTITNCGCIPKTTARNGPVFEDITGHRFGMLMAVRRAKSKNKKTQWLCACDCGNTRIVSTCMLKTGRVRHCGCETQIAKQGIKLDLKGKRFGRLVAVNMTEKRNAKGSVIWECLCDCGNIVEVSSEGLMQGNNTSCGCRKQEIKDSIGKYLTFVDGTCIEWLRSRKHRSDNTSGFRGVNKVKSGKWRVTIGFKNKRYHVGTFDTFEKAKKARLEIEKKLHDDFVFAWEKWNAIAENDRDWALNNTFIFDVCKVDGEIVVNAPIINNEINDAENRSCRRKY